MKKPPTGKIRRLRLIAELEERPEGWPADPLDTSAKVAALCWRLIGLEAQEVVIALHLSSRLNLTGWHVVARGTIDRTITGVREVFVPALLAGSRQLVVAHNHPSGDATPSADDRDLTERLVACGELLGMPVVDHLVISGLRPEDYYSFADNNEIRRGRSTWAIAATGELRSAGRRRRVGRHEPTAG